jgi:hypothetical protein
MMGLLTHGSSKTNITTKLIAANHATLFAARSMRNCITSFPDIGDDELPKSLIFVCGPGLRGVYFFRSQLSHKPYCGKITTHAISFSLRL